MMTTTLERSRFGTALATLWALNLKAMAPCLVWSVSVVILLQTSSLPYRILAISVANASSMACGCLIVNNYGAGCPSGWRTWFTDRFNWAALMSSGLLLALAIENVERFQNASRFMRVYVVAIFIAMLISWLFVSILVVPLRFYTSPRAGAIPTLMMTLEYIRENRTALAVAISVLLFGWPIFFLYTFLALAFAQSLLAANFPKNIRSSNGFAERSHSVVD